MKRAKKAAAVVEEEIVILDEELAAPEPVAVPVPTVVVVVAPEVKKKPLNKFQNFCKVFRPKLKVDKPTLQPKEVLTELGVMWKALSVAEQDKYI